MCQLLINCWTTSGSPQNMLQPVIAVLVHEGKSQVEIHLRAGRRGYPWLENQRGCVSHWPPRSQPTTTRRQHATCNNSHGGRSARRLRNSVVGPAASSTSCYMASVMQTSARCCGPSLRVHDVRFGRGRIMTASPTRALLLSQSSPFHLPSGALLLCRLLLPLILNALNKWPAPLHRRATGTTAGTFATVASGPRFFFLPPLCPSLCVCPDTLRSPYERLTQATAVAPATLQNRENKNNKGRIRLQHYAAIGLVMPC